MSVATWSRAGPPGLDARLITGKGAVRAVWQADISLDDVRVPAGSRLPGGHGFKDTGKVLAGTRSACAFSALGHAVAGYDAALTYAREREQFGKPLVSFQLVQEKLVRMLSEIVGMQLYCLRLAQLIHQGKISRHDRVLGQVNNTRKARQVILDARDILGGNGILLENHVIRHQADLEALYTYEGTDTMQALIVGRDITGVQAFA